MEDIIKHFSDAFLVMVGGIAIFVMIIAFASAGVLHTSVLAYLESICG